MTKPWWHRTPQPIDSLKPEFVESLNAPLMRPTAIMEAIVRYRQKGIPLTAIARETGIHMGSLSKYVTGAYRPGHKAALKLSWLYRALDAKQVKFVKAKGFKYGKTGQWVLVKGDVGDDAIVAKTTIGICPCGRYESCPCGQISGRTNANIDVAVQQNRMRKRV